MTPEETGQLLRRGRYRDALRTSLEGKSRAQIEGRPDDEVRWTLLAAHACRFIGRTADGLAHAAFVLERSSADPLLRAKSLHARAVNLKILRRYDEALDALREALGIPLPSGADFFRAIFNLELADCALEAGLRAEAEGALVRGSALVHWLKDPSLLSWSLYLRSQLEEVSPADLQLAAAYEIAREQSYPELEWMILWRLSERAEQHGRSRMRDDLLWNALRVLSGLAESLDPEDAASFWKHGLRRIFVEHAKQHFGADFLKRLMLEPEETRQTKVVLRELGFDPAVVRSFINPPEAE